MESTNNPNIKWAERKDKLYVTIQLVDVKEPKIDITEDNRLIFSGTSEGKQYSLNLELFGEVDRAESKWTLDTRNVFLNIKKKTKGSYWSYINKDKKKYHYIHVDWNLYIEEDEEDTKEPNMGFPGMGGNFMDMGGDEDYPMEPQGDEEEQADKNLDDLDKAEVNN